MSGLAIRSTLVAGVLLWAGGWNAGGAAAKPPKTPARSCTVEGVSAMSFGDYDPITGNQLDDQAQISYRCTSKDRKGPIMLEVSLSPGGAGTFNRRMQGGGDVLSYNLYLDAPRDVVWGDGTGGTQVFSDQVQPNNRVVTVPVFGRVFANQDVGPGVYLDNVIVTLNF